MHMLREREVAFGHLGGAFALLGAMAAVGSTAMGFVVWQMAAAGADAGQMSALIDRVQDTTGTAMLFTGGVFLLTVGMLILAMGLMRAHARTGWPPGCSRSAPSPPSSASRRAPRGC